MAELMLAYVVLKNELYPGISSKIVRVAICLRDKHWGNEIFQSVYITERFIIYIINQ